MQIIQSINNAKYGDIIFFEPIGGYSRLQVFIDCLGQKFQNTSHVSMFYKHVADTPLHIESTSNAGVHVTRIPEWRNYVIIRPDKTYLRNIGIVTRECGKKYDFSIIWAILKNRVFGKRIDPNDDTRPICSEFVNQSYGYTLDIKGYCTPVTLKNKLQTTNV